MDKSDPDAPTEWTFESFWQADIDDVHTCESRDAQRAARNVMRECIRFLNGNGCVFRSTNWDKNIPIDKKGYAPKGYIPEPLCSFLIESLEAAMQAKSKQVGKAMRIGGRPEVDKEKLQNIRTFLNHYNFLMANHARSDPEFSERQERAMVLEEIAHLMKVDLRTVQRYFIEAGGPGIGDFGYGWEYNPYEDEEE